MARHAGLLGGGLFGLSTTLTTIKARVCEHFRKSSIVPRFYGAYAKRRRGDLF